MYIYTHADTHPQTYICTRHIKHTLDTLHNSMICLQVSKLRNTSLEVKENIYQYLKISRLSRRNPVSQKPYDILQLVESFSASHGHEMTKTMIFYLCIWCCDSFYRTFALINNTELIF